MNEELLQKYFEEQLNIINDYNKKKMNQENNSFKVNYYNLKNEWDLFFSPIFLYELEERLFMAEIKLILLD